MAVRVGIMFLLSLLLEEWDGRKDEGRLMERYRRILPRSSHIPTRVSASTAQDDVSDGDLSP